MEGFIWKSYRPAVSRQLYLLLDQLELSDLLRYRVLSWNLGELREGRAKVRYHLTVLTDRREFEQARKNYRDDLVCPCWRGSEVLPLFALVDGKQNAA